MPGTLIGRLVRVLRGPAPIYLASSVLARLGAILLIPLYTRRLSPSEYGDFAVAQSILSFLPVIFTLGLISAVPKFYFAETNKAVGRANAGAVSLWLAFFTVILATPVCAGVIAFAPPGSGGALHRYELACVCVGAAGSAISSVPDILFRAEQRPYRAAIYQLIQFGLQLAMGLLFVLGLGRGLRGAIEAVAIAYGISGLASLAYILGPLGAVLDRKILRLALPFALPFIPHFLASWVQLAADRWTMKAFHLEGALGGYVLATQLTSPVVLIVTAWNDFESARLGEISRDGGIRGIAKQAGRLRLRYFLVACVPAVAIIACIPVAAAIVGVHFVSALRLMPLMAIFSIIEALYVPNSNILYYASRTRSIALITTSTAALNIALNLAFVPFFGVEGALGARLLTAIARTGVIWWTAQACLREAEATPTAGGETG